MIVSRVYSDYYTVFGILPEMAVYMANRYSKINEQLSLTCDLDFFIFFLNQTHTK